MGVNRDIIYEEVCSLHTAKRSRRSDGLYSINVDKLLLAVRLSLLDSFIRILEERDLD
jgi:hypothetical protein